MTCTLIAAQKLFGIALNRDNMVFIYLVDKVM